MIDLKLHGIDIGDTDIVVNDLIALANIKNNSVDARVLQDQGTHILVSGKHEGILVGTYAVVGGEIVRITASYNGHISNPNDPTAPLPEIKPPENEEAEPPLIDDGVDPKQNVLSSTKELGESVKNKKATSFGYWGNYTLFRVQRERQGTIRDNDIINAVFRTVVLAVDKSTDMVLTEWSFEDSVGSVSTNLFPCELSSGSISIISDISLWSPHDLKQRYKVRPNKSLAYIFKGVGASRVLKHTTTISKIGFNTRGKKEPNKIKLEIKNRLSQWYDKDLAINQQLKSTSPKEFFETLFELGDRDVYYAKGVDASSFIKISNLHTKEYKKYSELLKAYCSNGVRFCFDSRERVKIFSDFKVSGIESEKTVEYNITSSMLTEDDQMIYNSIDTKVTQRIPMYNFEDLNNKYVEFYRVLRGVAHSSSFMTRQDNGEIVINGIEIVNEDLHQSVQLKDYVLFKRSVAPFLEFYARVVAIEKGNKVSLMPMLYDKDYKLLQQGKSEYLFPIMVGSSCQMDIYYIREELPMIFKYTRNKGGEEKDSSLMYPILPRVDGETKYETEAIITFGCASNLKVGSYTGIMEEIDGIYGMWESDKLLYNMEKDQFSSPKYPPIFALSNRVSEKVVTNSGQSAFLLDYTHFDNSGLRVTIEKPNKAEGDAVLKLANTLTINSNIDTYISEELGRVSNRILQVEDIVNYEVGDVLIANKPDDSTDMEEAEYDEVLSEIKWTVTAKESQRDGVNNFKHYIFLDSNFPVRKDKNKKYKFTKFPNWSIVYLQELYFRGNPIIEHTQEVSGVARGTNVHGERSTEAFGEKKYEFDSKQLDKDGLKMIMGYILDNFQATDSKTTKFNAPISVFNGIDIELLDVISIEDPVYTKINSSIKWLVVSVSSKSKTNEVQLKLLNLNHSDTKPWKIDIKDVIEFAPVEIPKYDHAGGEGNTGDNEDGTGGSKEDKSLGQFWLAEIDPKLFRAKVDRTLGNYIYFKDFAGDEWELYVSKLFPQTEFGVCIDGEIMFVESDMNHRAFIKKRQVYDSDETIIQTEQDVKFYVVTTHVDIDGTFYSRKVHIGDGDTYFDFHPIKGAKFVGDFVIGENDKNSGNDLWESLQKNRTFYQDTVPKSDNSYTLREGDIWYDLNDENHVYRYNGDVWISCRDNSIISGQSSSFVQPEPPTESIGRPINNGDVWYDSDDGNKPYVYRNGEWVCVTDGNLEQAIADAKAQIDGMNGVLSDIASDNKLTASEKQQVKKEWDVIKTEYPLNLEKASIYEVGTILTESYADMYNELEAYLPPFLENLETTSDIVGVDFRKKFSNYYDSEVKMMNEVYDKVKDTAISSANSNTLNKLNQYTSDGVLTVSEKASLKSEIETIEVVFETISNRANSFGLSSVDLLPLKNILVVWKNGVLSQSDIYDNKEEVERLRSDFKKYYSEEEVLCDGIERKAKELADKAQADANGANAMLADISSDNKLTASEKQQVKKEWDVIKKEYQPNIDKANSYSVTQSLRTNYTNTYNSINIYLTPMLANLETTADIVGTDFRKKFSDYYDAEVKMMNEVYDKVKDTAISSANSNTLNKLNQYTSDGVLTVSEKAFLKSEAEMIENVFATLSPRATAFGISTSTLTTYKNVVVSWKNGVLSQGGNYEDSGQVSKLRTDFKNYYIEEETVYDGIERKAKELADKAQADANGANAMLADISSDNKLTASEKQQTKKEWDIIVGEYPKIIEEARKFGVNTSTYSSNFNVLNSYITPLLAEIERTSDIVGATFRQNFKSYYDSRQDVLNSINLKIPEINSMQNGKMLYLDPTFKNGTNGINVYNNNGNGTVSISLMTGEGFGLAPPNDSNKILMISKALGDASPNLGGFFFGTPTRAGMKLLTKIVAYIPVGYEISWYSNPTGDNPNEYWVTEQIGTGAFKEYVHVVECGKTGTFSSTSFFAIRALDGNQSKAVNWGLSYATVFDAGSNQNDYVTQALGNAKVFYSNTAPVSGMKQNDMWYDTDDGNHPHIFNGSVWISARDKIFETEGGNKVYFQDITPPVSGIGIKDGDMWFKTNENNKMFILKSGAWVLASDADNNIATGRVVINGNTTFNGDATIVSKGTNETTVIKGGSITFTRNGAPITVVRNIRYGTANISNGTPAVITLNGFKGTVVVLPTIREFNLSENTKSVECFVETVNQVNQQYKIHLRGVETVVQEEIHQGSKTNSYTQGGLLSLRSTTVSTVVNTNKTLLQKFNYTMGGASYSVDSLDYTATTTTTVSSYNGREWNVVGTTSSSPLVELVWEGSSDKSLYVKAQTHKTNQNEQTVRSYSGGLVTLGVSVSTTTSINVTVVVKKQSPPSSSGVPPAASYITIRDRAVDSSSSTSFQVYTATKIDTVITGSGKVQYIAMEE